MACETAAKRRLAITPVVLACAVAVLFAFTAPAEATETIYWDNFNNDSVSFANIDGGGGGSLDPGGVELSSPEGMAYDTVTNRLFIASKELGEILFVNLDGSGAGALATPGVAVHAPQGMAIDPGARTAYWINNEPGGDQAIAWARLDGSGGELLNVAGATLEGAARLAIDPVVGRVYWGNGKPTDNSISFANVNNTGAGDLSLSGATPSEIIDGVAVDPAAGRIYWLNEAAQTVSFTNVSGGGGDIGKFGAPFAEAIGLALDPALGKLYWANYGTEEKRTGAFGIALLAGGSGVISPQTAPVNGPQDPVILKSPSGTGAPTVSRDSEERSTLSCSIGAWAPDHPGSFVYQAPRTFAYQWKRDGVALAGEVASTFAAQSPGTYGCVVTATNQTGSARQTSLAVNVQAAKLKLTTKRKAHAKPGQTVKFRVTATNQGDLISESAKVCAKLPKSAKGELKAPKCRSLGGLEGGGKRSAKLKIKVLGSAGGTYKVTFQVKGSAGKAAKSKLVVG
jgi:DNA-binding beta-propeller fold protein YncE